MPYAAIATRPAVNLTVAVPKMMRPGVGMRRRLLHGYARYSFVIVHLPSRSIAAASLHPKLVVWLGSLAVLMVFNIGLWISIARFGPMRTPYVETQLLLSGVYVGVCGFRSIYPRVDLERVCLWDTWLSAILLGRIAATVAEM